MSLIWITKVAAAGALGAATLVPGAGATHSAGPASSTSDATVVCHRLRSQAPEALRADLRHLRTLPKDERREAARQIRKDALTGKYGNDVQRFLEHRKAARKAARKKLLSQASSKLREDLKAARKLPADQRKEAVRKVRAAALVGTYGNAVKTLLAERADQRKRHHETCHARPKAQKEHQDPEPDKSS